MSLFGSCSLLLPRPPGDNQGLEEEELHRDLRRKKQKKKTGVERGGRSKRGVLSFPHSRTFVSRRNGEGREKEPLLCVSAGWRGSVGVGRARGVTLS